MKIKEVNFYLILCLFFFVFGSFYSFSNLVLPTVLFFVHVTGYEACTQQKAHKKTYVIDSCFFLLLLFKYDIEVGTKRFQTHPSHTDIFR